VEEIQETQEQKAPEPENPSEKVVEIPQDPPKVTKSSAETPIEATEQKEEDAEGEIEFDECD